MHAPTSHASPDFRPDINGLRALAVAVVVLYHFHVPGFGGGFVGVDVFFVISGFLMTRIILRGLEQGRFDLWSFFAARARRIVPALAVLCAALLLYGMLRLTPPDFERLARHAAGSLAFVSNVVYWRDVDYFGATKHDQWLLHTWSLSVEWQFYLLLPLGLLAVARVWRGRPRALATALVAAFLLSLAASALLSHTNRIPAFYLLPTRAWEMLAGGLVFLAGSRGPVALRRLAAPLGLLLIAASVALCHEQLPWPSLYAGVPVLGACLVVWGHDTRSPWLANRAAQFLGDSSYSIYLWHWPLVAVLHQHLLADSPAWVAGAIVLSVVLGHLSLRLVETPTRESLGRLSLRGNGLAFAGTCALVGGAALGVWAQHGLPQRPNVQDYAAAAARVQFANRGTGWCFADNVDGRGPGTKGLRYRPEFSRCHVGDLQGREEALLWGDSHAGHFSPYVAAFARERRIRVHELSTAACPPLFDSPDEGVHPDICRQFQQDVRDGLPRYRRIVIAGRWDYYMRHPTFRDDLEATLRALTRHGAQVVVLGQTPLFSAGVGKHYIHAAVFKRDFPEWLPGSSGPAQANALLRDAAARVPGVRYAEPTADLCADGQCRLAIDGVPAFYDANHLNIAGAQLLARRAQARGEDLFQGM